METSAEEGRGAPAVRAVCTRQACKKYGQVAVLRNLSMTVQQGTIYGLLGASGCGKTTLLSCVVGRRRLDSGQVTVLGVAPGTSGSGVPGRRVGYMPQDLALHPGFTVRETLHFFGRVFNMSAEQVEKKLKFLLEMLDLPAADKMVRHLSGGQQRRVSFMVALLHDPELLILDEPTVGMDPVLRQVIWEHLRCVADRYHTTIIITTHYIEEARHAHRIGLMRSGHLLDEDCPGRLLAKYGCPSLEQVFLQLSEKQERGLAASGALGKSKKGSRDITGVTFDLPQLTDDAESEYWLSQQDYAARDSQKVCGLASGATLRALLYRNFMTIRRDPAFAMFVFGLVVVTVTSIYLAFGGEPWGLRLGVVNRDADCSRAAPLRDCRLAELSCQYLRHLAYPTVVKEFFSSKEAALEAVRRGRVWGALYFSENFTRAVLDRISYGQAVSEGSLEQSNVDVWLDMSNQLIGGLLREELRFRFLEFSQSLFVACNYSAKAGGVPVRFEEPVFGSRRPTFLNFTAPALLLFVMFFFGLALSVWTIIHERKEGLLDRIIVAGVTSFEIMLSYFLSQLAMMCGQVLLLMVFSFFIYQIECVGNLALVLVLTLLQGISGMFFGFLISIMCDNESTATHIGSGCLYPMIFMCGIVWPAEGMHASLTYFYRLMPLTVPVEAMRAVVSRGWPADKPEVYMGFAVSVLWIALFLAMSVLAIRYKRL
ncbi:ABC transporter G family member 20-like isoform X2 [Bacillus rossius redtenbacheri]|uniref:ABC transporter G family member 20-like isoform X2 n=1 Tax=Bacillus rossius redtenbacheri TaxID=93214 RepID=UPI002FDDE73C